MIEPVIDVDGVRLYEGDCRDVLDSLKIPANAGWVIDPPWQLSIALPVGTNKLVFSDGGRIGSAVAQYGPPTWVFTWDCVSSWYTKNRPLRRAKYALWYGAASEYVFDGAHYGGERQNVARVVQNSRGAYLFQQDSRGKHLSDVFTHPITALHKFGPSHEKPLEWIRMLIANCFAGAPLIIDPFCGSGVVLDACRSMGMQAIGIEMDPVAVHAIRSRLSQTVIVA